MSWGVTWWARSMMRQSGLIRRMTPFIAPMCPSPHPKSVKRVMIGLAAIFSPDPPYTFLKRRFHNPFFRDDGAHIAVRGDIKGGVTDLDPPRGQASPPQGGNLRSIALLDRDILACLGVSIKGGEGGSHVEGYPMLLRQDGHGIGPDLIGYITVGGDPVCPEDTPVDLPLLNGVSTHTV